MSDTTPTATCANCGATVAIDADCTCTPEPPPTWGEYAAKYGRASLPAARVDLGARVPECWITDGVLA